jgi:hypothetical protein
MSVVIDSWSLDGYRVANSEISVDVYRTLDKVRRDRRIWLDTFFKFRQVFRDGLKRWLVYNPRPAYVFYPEKYIDCDVRVALFNNSIWLAAVPNYFDPNVWWVVRIGWGAERGWVYDSLLFLMETEEKKVIGVFANYVGNGVDIHTKSREFYKQAVKGIMFHEKFEQFRKIGGNAVLEPLRGLLDFIEFLEVADA